MGIISFIKSKMGGNSMKRLGIDISAWQKGYPYANAKNEGVEFVILRAGSSLKKDSEFETHYANAKSLGWDVGAYWYSYATSVEEAKQEAQAFLNAIQGKQYEYPIYLDIEDKSIRDNTTKAERDEIVRAFGNIIESAGYYFGVYCNEDWYRNQLSGSELNKKYDWWIAKWSTSEPSGINYGLWQFGGETNFIRSNKIAGVVTDQDYAVKDYPTIIKSAKLNGFSTEVKPEPIPTPAPQPQVSEQTYTIVKGDTLSSIGKKFGVDYKTIASYNNISNPNVIYIGQVIKIPAGIIGKPSTNINVGSKVRVKNGARSYTNERLATFVYQKTYDVISINGDRVVIGIGSAVTAAVNKNDLYLA